MDAHSAEPMPALLATKIGVPVTRPGLIHRSRLVRLLSSDQERTVVLVRAPAGYGKSTLLQQWAADDEAHRFAWVELDPSENDPVLFWRYVLAALRIQVPGLADSAWEMLGRPAPNIDAVVSDLLNGLVDVNGRLVVVLDDYHVIDNPECHRMIQFFVDHLPRTTQVALSSRTRPPLSLSRLLARGLLIEIGSDELQFTPAETAEAVRRVAPFTSAEDALTVHERMEGWPVGVYLTTLDHGTIPSIANTANGNSRAIRHFLVDEILDQLPAEQRAFLWETSILERLSGDLCDHVTGRTDSSEMLAGFASANLLLIPLDERGCWYRYHHLLRETLQGEPRGDGAEVESVLHTRASEWWLANGDASLAIHHAIESGQLATAGDLICAHWAEYLYTGNLETIRRWLVHYPDHALFDHPPLVVAAAWIAAFRGDVDATHRFAHTAERAAYVGNSPDGAFSYESSVAMLLAGLGLNGVTAALEHAETAYRLESPGSPLRPVAAVIAGTTRAAVGEADRARTALVEASRAPGGLDGIAVYALGQLALLEASEGKWEAASDYARRGRDLIDRFGLQDLLSSGAAYTASALVEAHQGNAAEARRQLQLIAPLQARLSDAIPFDAFQIHLIVAETYLSIGDDAAARVHANAAATRLTSLVDGGVLALRLEMLLNNLGTADEDMKEPPAANSDPLTTRERQILTLLPTTLSLREIGHELYVSRNTTKTHVARIYRKLGVSNRTAAIARARELELI